jgi:uncharacterized SAM-binding protein YcdF (DUF218 family)
MRALMTGKDVLLRGRGAEIGARAPLWLVRACGAVLGLTCFLLSDALGIWQVLGLSTFVTQCVLLVVGAIVAPSALGGALWLINALLVCALMLVSYTPLVEPMVAPFVRADAPMVTSGAMPPADAIIVLSGAISADGRMAGQALDRLLTAIPLARARAVPELALSVVTRGERTSRVTSEADQRALVAMAEPSLALHFVHDVHSTRDEALAFAALARTRGWHRVLVVTSPLHTRRACAALEMQGLSVECHPAESRDYSLRAIRSGENRRLAFQDVLYETAATALYRSRGWMR